MKDLGHRFGPNIAFSEKLKKNFAWECFCIRVQSSKLSCKGLFFFLKLFFFLFEECIFHRNRKLKGFGCGVFSLP